MSFVLNIVGVSRGYRSAGVRPAQPPIRLNPVLDVSDEPHALAVALVRARMAGNEVLAEALATRRFALSRRPRLADTPDARLAGGLHICWGLSDAAIGRRLLGLSRLEFRLLAALARRPGWLIERADLFEQVWERPLNLSLRQCNGHLADPRMLNRVIGRLRVKLRTGGAGKAVETRIGFGYRLRSEAEGEAVTA